MVNMVSSKSCFTSSSWSHNNAITVLLHITLVSIDINAGHFFYYFYSSKIYLVGTCWNCLSGAIPASTHKICFASAKKKKTFSDSSLNLDPWVYLKKCPTCKAINLGLLAYCFFNWLVKTRCSRLSLFKPNKVSKVLIQFSFPSSPLKK